MEFKNYKVLCEYLGEMPRLGGKNQGLHKNEWEKFFKWDKVGNKFIITEVFKKDVVRKVVFKDAISVIMLNILMRADENPYNVPRKKLLIDVGMTNKRFDDFATKGVARAKYAKSSNHLFFSVDDYFSRTANNNRSRLNSALEFLNKKDFVIYRNSYILRTQDDKGLNIYRQSTLEEELKIMNLRRDLLNQMGYEDLSDVFRKGEQEAFYKLLTIIVNEHLNVQGYYAVISLTYNATLIRSYLESRNLVFSDEELKQEVRLLNDFAVDKIIKLAEKDNDKVEQQDSHLILTELMDTPNEERKMMKEYDKKYGKGFGAKFVKGLPDYLETTKELAELTVKLDSDDIVEDSIDDWSYEIFITSILDDIPDR